VTGPIEDPIVESTTETKGGEEELVIVIAGGMTSQLTYDGIDVCASRVAYEVCVHLRNFGVGVRYQGGGLMIG
jgi:hypothetical protein